VRRARGQSPDGATLWPRREPTTLAQHDIHCSRLIFSIVAENDELLTAVICTRNRRDQIGAAVRSVLDNDDSNFELIVIDQSDTRDTHEALSAVIEDPRLRYFHTTRVGLSAAYNAAVREARGSVYAFTDDDCLAPKGWLETVRREFAADPGADLIYGEVRAPAEFHATGVIPELRFPSRRRLTINDGFMVIGMGANFAARSSLFERIGGFDEMLGGGGPLRSSQDFDFQYRLFRASASHVCVLSADLHVTHYGYRTPEEWGKTLRAYGVGDGAFYMKHVRCGDVRAGRLLAVRVWNEVIRVTAKPLVGRHHNAAYLRGLIEGSVKSFHFKVDRRRRLYVAP
jgi:glycosyltransferase involved in cell wall biosynthesis